MNTDNYNNNRPNNNNDDDSTVIHENRYYDKMMTMTMMMIRPLPFIPTTVFFDQKFHNIIQYVADYVLKWEWLDPMQFMKINSLPFDQRI